MSDPSIQVHRGDISTYEGASDEYLKKRTADLRASIRNPHLTAGEFVQNVAGQAVVSAAAVGYSAWFGMNNLLPRLDKWFKKVPLLQRLKIKLERIDEDGNHRTYAYELESHKANFQELAGHWAHLCIAGDKEENFDVLTLTKRIQHSMQEHNFTTGADEIAALIKHFEEHPEIPEAARKTALMELCHDISIKHPEAHLAKVFRLFEEVEEKCSALKATTTGPVIRAVLPRIEAFTDELKKNNEKIIAKYRTPAVVLAVTAAVAVTGWRAYKVARRDKTLGEETEISHIERLQDERKHQSEAPQQQPAVS